MIQDIITSSLHSGNHLAAANPCVMQHYLRTSSPPPVTKAATPSTHLLWATYIQYSTTHAPCMYSTVQYHPCTLYVQYSTTHAPCMYSTVPPMHPIHTQQATFKIPTPYLIHLSHSVQNKLRTSNLMYVFYTIHVRRFLYIVSRS